MASLISLCALLALPTAASETAAEPPPPPPVVAIHALQPLGTDPEIATRLGEMLCQEAGRLRGITLVEGCQTPPSLEQCEGQLSCLARLGSSCGADKVVTGTVASLGDSYVLDLKLIAVATQSEERRLSTRLAGDRAVLIEGVRSAAARLLVPDQYVGTVHIQLDAPGAKVYLDGKLVGETPLAPLTQLEPGQHGLKIALTGYQDFDRFVDVQFDRITIVAVKLTGSAINATISAQDASLATRDTAPLPAAPSPLLIAGVGTAAAGTALALAGGGMLGLMYLDLSRHTENVDGIVVVTEPDQYDRRKDGYSWWPVGWVLIGVGTAAVIAGSGLLALDLFEGAP